MSSSSSSTLTTDLSWLPSDHEEQLNLSFRIISTAFKNRVTALDAETNSLKAQLSDKIQQLQAVTKKLNSVELQLIGEGQRANQLSEENKQLAATIRKLTKDINRLEIFKKNVEASIKEERVDADDTQRFYSPEDILQSAAPRTMQEINRSESLPNTWGIGNNFFNSNTNLSSSVFPSQDSKASDGKAFFRVLRNRIPIEQFNAFIANLKKLNQHQQSRDETIRIANQILGEGNADLFEDFKLMLIRNA